MSFKIMVLTVTLSFGVSQLWSNNILTIEKSSVLASSQLGKVKVSHNNEGFQVIQNGIRHKVQSCFVDKELRSISKENLQRYLAVAKVAVAKVGENEFAIRSHVPGKGGGFLGATIGAFLGKAAVSVIGHGAILVVSGAVGIFCPPAGWALGVSLESTCGPMIEAASIKGAIAGGIAGGVATGPV